MSISIDIPQDAETTLRAGWGGNLEQAAKEALVIESYRTGKITVGFLAGILGLTRWEAEAWLAKRGIEWNYDLADLEADRRTADEITGK
jgi:predicted HTH domain antitoxin